MIALNLVLMLAAGLYGQWVLAGVFAVTSYLQFKRWRGTSPIRAAAEGGDAKRTRLVWACIVAFNLVLMIAAVLNEAWIQAGVTSIFALLALLQLSRWRATA